MSSDEVMLVLPDAASKCGRCGNYAGYSARLDGDVIRFKLSCSCGHNWELEARPPQDQPPGSSSRAKR